MRPESVKTQLCAAFCDGFHVAEVPDGLLVETPFALADGDYMDFLIRNAEGCFRLEDDGMMVAEAAAGGIDLGKGTRRQILDDILVDCDVNFEEDEGFFFTEQSSRGAIGPAAVRFVEALLRARDVAMLSRERVASSFVDDLEAALSGNLAEGMQLSRADEQESDNPSDIVIFKNKKPVGFIYAVTSTEKLLSALVRHLETGIDEKERSSVPMVFAALEALSKVSQKRFAHAQNRGLAMPIADGNMNDVVRYIDKHLQEAA